MSSVFKRPGNRWYARLKNAEGKWVSRRIRQQTRADAKRVAAAMEAREERIRVGLEAPEAAGQLVGALMKKWASSLSNRSRDTDVGRLDRHVFPHWRNVRVAEIGLPKILTWLDQLAEAGEIGPASQRHCLGLLSRFMSWCVERGHASRNPCRDVPVGRRPRATPPQNVPWINSDDQVLAIMRKLPVPYSLIFYVGNRSGLRLSEITALRLSDLDEIEAGTVRVRFAGEDGTGPLKEAKAAGRVKFVPAPIDAMAVLGPHLERRRAAGAGPENFVFVDVDGEHLAAHQIGFRWRKAAKELGLPPGLNFYRATRHSFASRASAAGASIDEISGALGHSSPAITQAHYMHFQRRRWSPAMHAGLGLDVGSPVARVLPMLSTPAAPAESVDDETRPLKTTEAEHVG